MPIVELVDGKTANIPDKGFIVINGEEANKAQSICVVAVRNAPEGMPVFAYCVVGKTVAELDDKELKAIDTAIGEACPRYREIIESSSKPGCHQRKNLSSFKDDWKSAIEPGYFDLEAFPEYWVPSASPISSTE